MQKVRQVVEKAHAERKAKAIPVRQPLTSYTTESKAPTDDLDNLLMEEINAKKIIWGDKNEGFDTAITPELEEESKARELIRKIQEERKSLGMNLTQGVVVAGPWLPKDKKLVQRIKDKTLASKLTLGDFKVTKA